MEVLGIDVSHWQQDTSPIDWDKVKDSGKSFVFIKAAQGSDTGKIFPDPQFKKMVEEAAESGIGIGVYLYSAAMDANTAKIEAENLVKLIEPYRESITWPVAYDIEMPKQEGKNRRSINTAQAQAFCKAIKDAGYTPMLYCNPAWAASYIDAGAVGADVWLAHYTYEPGKTSYRGEYAIHQYSDNGKVNGIKGDVDLNIAFKDYGEDNVRRYHYVMECPDWSIPTLNKLIRKGALKGGENGDLNLTEDMLRILVINDRAGAYGE